jgi:hypothetical protein
VLLFLFLFAPLLPEFHQAVINHAEIQWWAVTSGHAVIAAVVLLQSAAILFYDAQIC